MEASGNGVAEKSWLYLDDVEIGVNSYMEDFNKHLLGFVKPEWVGVELESKIFDTGITNMLVAIYQKEKGLRESREDVVLLRVNGMGTERLIDRTDEIICILTLHKVGLCPPLYAQLKNGLCYGFLPGRQMGVAEVREEVVSGKIAKLMARLHHVDIPHHFQGRRPAWEKVYKILTDIPEQYEDPAKQKCFAEAMGSKELLEREIEWAKALTSTCNSPIVFCHNDTLIANFIIDDKTGEVGLVDYEYGGPNYLAYDIANHFCEFAGVEEVNFDLYPDQVFQMRWIRIYLLERAKLKGEGDESVSEDHVKSLYEEVNKFAMVSHLMWGVWALVQTIYSTIDFDYMQYAVMRYGEFLKRKSIYVATTAQLH